MNDLQSLAHTYIHSRPRLFSVAKYRGVSIAFQYDSSVLAFLLFIMYWDITQLTSPAPSHLLRLRWNYVADWKGWVESEAALHYVTSSSVVANASHIIFWGVPALGNHSASGSWRF